MEFPLTTFFPNHKTLFFLDEKYAQLHHVHQLISSLYYPFLLGAGNDIKVPIQVVVHKDEREQCGVVDPGEAVVELIYHPLVHLAGTLTSLKGILATPKLKDGVP